MTAKFHFTAALFLLPLLPLLSAPQPQPQPASPAGADNLSVARAALRDGLCPIAERHALAALREGPAARREEALLALFEALAGQKDYAGLLRRWQAEPPGGGAGVSGTNAPAFAYWRALALLETGACGEAAREAGEAARRGPSVWRDGLLRIAARARLRSGGRQEAWALFAELDGTSSNAAARADNALEWALSLKEAGEDGAALDVLKRQAELPVRSESVDDGQLLRGRLLLGRGREADAAAVFNRLALNGRASERARVQALLEMSVHAWGAGKTNEAVAYARSAYARASGPETRRAAGFRLGDLLAAAPGTREEGAALIRGLVRERPEAPGAADALLKLADSLLQTGRPEQAAAEYRIFLETYPASTLDCRALQGRGWALLRLGKNGEAAAAFRQAAKLTDDPDARMECGLKVCDALMAEKQYREAAAEYRKLADGAPGHPLAGRARFQCADALERAGDREAAAAQYRIVAESAPAGPEAPRALLRLAALQAGAGRFDEALRTYTAILSGTRQKELRTEALMGRGKTSYRIYRFDAAMQDFAAVVESGREGRDEARFMLALCLYGVGRDKEARAAAEAFLTDFPESPRLPDMTLWLGKFDFNRGRYAEARGLFESYVARWPESRWADAARLWAARAAFSANDFTGCIEGVTGLIRAFPESARLPEALLLQADALIELARFDEAVLLLDRVIGRAPESEWAGRARLRKGDCLFTMGADNSRRYEEALAAYRARLKEGALPPAALLRLHFKIARCYEKLKMPDEAIDEYYARVMLRFLEERARGIWFGEGSASLFLRAAFNAADLYERQGKNEQAVRVLRRAARANVPGADEARRRIERLKAKKAGA